MNFLSKPFFILIFTLFLGTTILQTSPSFISKVSLLGTGLFCAATLPLAKNAYSKACKNDPNLAQTTSFSNFYKNTIIALFNPKTAKKTAQEYPFLAHALYISTSLGCFTGYSFISDYRQKQTIKKAFEEFSTNLTQQLAQETPDFEKLKQQETELKVTLEKYINTFNHNGTAQELEETLNQTTKQLNTRLADYLEEELAKPQESSKKSIIALAKEYTKKALAQNGYDQKALKIKQVITVAALNEKIFTLNQETDAYCQYEFIEEPTAKKLLNQIEIYQKQLLPTSVEYLKLEEKKQNIITHDTALTAEEEALQQENEIIEQTMLETGNLLNEVTSNLTTAHNDLDRQKQYLRKYDYQTNKYKDHEYVAAYDAVENKLLLLNNDLYQHSAEDYRDTLLKLTALQEPLQKLDEIVNAPFIVFKMEPNIVDTTKGILTKLNKELKRLKEVLDLGPIQQKPLDVQIILKKFRCSIHTLSNLLKVIPTKYQDPYKTIIQELDTLTTYLKGKKRISFDLQMELEEQLKVITNCIDNIQIWQIRNQETQDQITDFKHTLHNTIELLKTAIEESLTNNNTEEEEEEEEEEEDLVINTNNYIQINIKLKELNDEANNFTTQKIPQNCQQIFFNNINQIKELIALLTKKETTKQQAMAKLRTITTTMVNLNKKLLNNPLIGYVVPNDTVIEGKNLLIKFNKILQETKAILINR